ncbi:MAG: N-acetyltransferase family protein [Actinomycetes bacterium]
MGWIIRAAEPTDAEAIRAIYNREVEGSTVTFDMVERSLEEQLTWISEHSGGHPAVVAVDEKTAQILGFGSLTAYRPRPAYSITVEDSVYVRDDSRGLGLGQGILEELVRLAGLHGYHSIIARIVGDHEASIKLHAAAGFIQVGRETEVGRKHGRWLDVVLMQRMI